MYQRIEFANPPIQHTLDVSGRQFDVPHHGLSGSIDTQNGQLRDYTIHVFPGFNTNNLSRLAQAAEPLSDGAQYQVLMQPQHFPFAKITPNEVSWEMIGRGEIAKLSGDDLTFTPLSAYDHCFAKKINGFIAASRRNSRSA